MKFSDYTNKNIDDFINENKSKLDNLGAQSRAEINNISQLLEGYQGMSSDQIMSEFLRVADQKRKDGTLNFEYLNNIQKTLFPYLNEEQKQMFNSLLNQIK